MSDAPFEAQREYSRRRRWVALAAFAVVAAGVAGSAALFARSMYGNEPFVDTFPIAFPLFLVTVSVLFALVQTWRHPRKALARIRADARGLFANDALVVAREAIRSAYVQPREDGPPTVRLVCREAFESVEVEAHDVEDGTKLLAALALDSSRAVVHFRVRRGIFASNRAQGIASGILGSSGYMLWLYVPHGYRIPAVVALLVLFLVNSFPSKMSIGADGVLVASVRGRRFYPFANVASVETSTWGIVLVTRRGERVEIRTRRRATHALDSPDDATRAMVARIRAGVDALASGGTTAPDAAALVGRGARTYDAWIEALRELSRDGHYRAAALPTEQLWRVLEDPAAEASARAGAALALRESLDAEGRARLRVAGAASASPRVRVALDAIASSDADDAELRAALEACASENDAAEPRARA